MENLYRDNTNITKPNKAHYLYYKKKLLDNINFINKEFKKVLINQNHLINDFIIAYSFKTNNSINIIKTIQQTSLWAEVVSPEELYFALNQGFTYSNIIFNGVCKTSESIEQCLINGSIVNVDSIEDINKCRMVAKKYNTKANIGLRLNFDVGNGITSRFGLDTEYIDPLIKDPLLNIVGLHCHFSHAKQFSSWILRAQKMCQYGTKIPNLKYLDFGGNMTDLSNKDLFIQYGKVINENINNTDFKNKIDVIIEPGTPLVHDVFDLECNVISIKKDFVFTDCCMFDLGIHTLNDKCKIKVFYNPEIKDENRMQCKNCNIVGYTCMENDVLKKSFNGKLAVGDKIRFYNVGDYSYSWSNNFINNPLDIIDIN